MMNEHDHYALKTVVQRCISLERECTAMKAQVEHANKIEQSVLVQERADHQKTIDTNRKEREKLNKYLSDAINLLRCYRDGVVNIKTMNPKAFKDFESEFVRLSNNVQNDHPGAPYKSV